MSMFIILPNKRTGLAELEAKLNDLDIQNLSKSMYRSEVDVSIPKFKIEFEVSLVETLRKVIGTYIPRSHRNHQIFLSFVIWHLERFFSLFNF